MKGGRIWIFDRQAYTPRPWALVPVVALIAAAISWFINPPVWATVLIGLVVGVGAVRIQWWLWRRKHPILPPEVIARQRARWN